jgi:hypothetical protein
MINNIPFLPGLIIGGILYLTYRKIVKELAYDVAPIRFAGSWDSHSKEWKRRHGNFQTIIVIIMSLLSLIGLSLEIKFIYGNILVAVVIFSIFYMIDYLVFWYKEEPESESI